MREVLAVILIVLLIAVIQKPESVGQWVQRVQQGLNEPVKH